LVIVLTDYSFDCPYIDIFDNETDAIEYLKSTVQSEYRIDIENGWQTTLVWDSSGTHARLTNWFDDHEDVAEFQIVSDIKDHRAIEGDDTVMSHEPDYVYFENTYTGFDEDGNAFVCIDGYPRDEELSGTVIAVVYLTPNRDFVTSWHRNDYRENAAVLELVNESKRILPDMIK
jgi:hypothetical protein